MFTSLNQLGSVILDVNDNRLDAYHLRSNGVVTDHYTMSKGSDLLAPTISTVSSSTVNQVNVSFSEIVTAATAENINNYSIDNGIGVLSASLSGSNVTLTTSALTEGINFTLTVNNVEDTNGNIIAPNSQATFSFQNIQTLSFQNGVTPENNYAGTEDAYIASGVPTSNFGSATTLLADGNDGTNGELATLIKWDVSDIPSDATITEVRIELELFNPSSGTYNLYDPSNAWNENTANWNSIDPYFTRGQVVGNLLASSTGNYSIALDSAGIGLVQNWVNGPANDGVLLMTGGSNDGIDIRSSEYNDNTLRPKLIVTYNTAPGGNALPVADFNFAVSSLNVNFTDTSNDTDGSIIEWAWDFGGGNTATAQNPSHIYAIAGTYQVSLTVTDDAGDSHTTTQEVIVTAPSDTVAPSIPTGLTIDNTTTNSVALSWNAATDNQGVVGYKLRRDDVLIADINSTSFIDTNLSSNTTFGYTIEAYDGAGNHSGVSTAVSATTGNLAPTANFNFISDQLNVDFTDTSNDIDGTITNWSWNFGEGTSSTIQNPSHSYASEGNYDVSLTVTDSNGDTNTTIQTVIVSNVATLTTIELQQDLNGYIGAEDTYVAEGRSNNNYGNASSIHADGDDGRRDELITLFRWDVSNIPTGAKITDVILTLQVHNRTNNIYNFWSMLNAWDENTATWSNSQPATNRGANIGSFTPTSRRNYTIQFNAAGITMVQSWVNGSVNDGFSLASGGTRNGVGMRSSEYSNQAQRPMLTITYQ